MEQERAPSGDYGYDLAHLETSGGTGAETPGRSPARRSESEPVGPSPAARAPDLQDDLGYDQAHDF